MLALGLLENAFDGFALNIVALLNELPLLDKSMLVAPDRLEVFVQHVGTDLHG